MVAGGEKKKTQIDIKAASAHEIIEHFGGIRPMASKLGIAVSTVQGWKERNKIPEQRYVDIQNILVQESSQTDQTPQSRVKEESQVVHKSEEKKISSSSERKTISSSSSHRDHQRSYQKNRDDKVDPSSQSHQSHTLLKDRLKGFKWFALSVVAFGVIALAILFFPSTFKTVFNQVTDNIKQAEIASDNQSNQENQTSSQSENNEPEEQTAAFSENQQSTEVSQPVSEQNNANNVEEQEADVSASASDSSSNASRDFEEDDGVIQNQIRDLKSSVETINATLDQLVKKIDEMPAHSSNALQANETLLPQIDAIKKQIVFNQALTITMAVKNAIKTDSSYQSQLEWLEKNKLALNINPSHIQILQQTQSNISKDQLKESYKNVQQKITLALEEGETKSFVDHVHKNLGSFITIKNTKSDEGNTKELISKKINHNLKSGKYDVALQLFQSLPNSVRQDEVAQKWFEQLKLIAEQQRAISNIEKEIIKALVEYEGNVSSDQNIVSEESNTD